MSTGTDPVATPRRRLLVAAQRLSGIESDEPDSPLESPADVPVVGGIAQPATIPDRPSKRRRQRSQ